MNRVYKLAAENGFSVYLTQINVICFPAGI